jgi:alpha-L-fucosidase 2
MKQQHFLFCALLGALTFPSLWAQDGTTNPGLANPAKNDVTWTALGKNENDSMPLGNGDIGLNAWTEANGDIVLLVGKDDAWSENGELLKLGRVRIKLSPNPFVGSGFSQTLKLETGELVLVSGATTVRIWVDANHPVAHVEVHSDQPLQLQAALEVWRMEAHSYNPKGENGALGELRGCPFPITLDPDTVLPAKNDRLAVCHFNVRSIYPMVLQQEHLDSLADKYPDPLLHSCFGMAISGPGLKSQDDKNLQSGIATDAQLDLYALTQKVDAPEQWSGALDKIIAQTGATSLEDARTAHQAWWAEFWNRSWLHVEGTPDAAKVSQGYAMQRYFDACAGRGAQPIKYNGSIFTVGHDVESDKIDGGQQDADFRRWGSCFWNQNNRLIYWPLMATGDYDLLQPWFDAYVKSIPMMTERTQLYYHHGGVYFPETFYFWMLPNVNNFGWNNKGTEIQNPWIRLHTQGGLEVIAQMLDYMDNTEDATFAHDKLLPMADAVLAYYDQHWKRGDDGKIVFNPDQALETYQSGVTNPTPDIAGLKSDLPRLLALPETLTTPDERSTWTKLLNDLPAIPTGTTANGKVPPKGQGDPSEIPTILPAGKYGGTANSENPELYVAFPYRLYGVGKPDLELARQTYAARLFPQATCWGQDGTESSILGLTDEAKKVVTKEFTNYGSHFSWFWAPAHDWIPDMDNGGSGMITLQNMIMQCDGKRIQLLPAWPADWTADFKLHAPYNTIVEGHVEQGKITNLKVTPQAREKDVVVVPAS